MAETESILLTVRAKFKPSMKEPGVEGVLMLVSLQTSCIVDGAICIFYSLRITCRNGSFSKQDSGRSTLDACQLSQRRKFVEARGVASSSLNTCRPPTMVSILPLIANSSRSQLRTLPESCATNSQSRVHRPLHLTAMLPLKQENANTTHTNDCADPEICKMDTKQPRRCGSPFHRLPNNQEWVFGPSPSYIALCFCPWVQE
jgi:hypothetical protein